ncbi:Uncharacterised protein [Mycobacteroides abscessus subsp. abscessus]|nr:Uncharacterised protein [Mycobacteroides abscessus subsp. abscessus]
MLLGSAVGDERRTEQLFPQMVDLVRRLGPGILLIEDDALAHRGPAAAVLHRPAQAGPTRRGQMTIPGEPLIEGLVLAAGPAEPLQLGELSDEVLRQPFPDFGAYLIIGHLRHRFSGWRR